MISTNERSMQIRNTLPLTIETIVDIEQQFWLFINGNHCELVDIDVCSVSLIVVTSATATAAAVFNVNYVKWALSTTIKNKESDLFFFFH